MIEAPPAGCRFAPPFYAQWRVLVFLLSLAVCCCSVCYKESLPCVRRVIDLFNISAPSSRFERTGSLIFTHVPSGTWFAGAGGSDYIDNGFVRTL